MHEVEAHGNERQAHEEIERASDELELGLGVRVVDRVAGHVVAEADRAQRDEAEVDALEDGPFFERLKEDAAEQDVRAEHEEREGDGHRDLLVVGGVVLVEQLEYLFLVGRRFDEGRGGVGRQAHAVVLAQLGRKNFGTLVGLVEG